MSTVVRGLLGLLDLQPRQDLAIFTDHMEEKLRRNDHKKHDGEQAPIGVLLHRLKMEVIELEMALQYEGTAASMAEAVDVANFAMLIHKRLNHRTVNDLEISRR